jgi:hypothetical protein
MACMIWGIEQGAVFVGQWREDQVDMIWHDHSRVQNAFLVVDVSAGFQGEVSSQVGELPALMRGESDEEGFAIFLDMG